MRIPRRSAAALALVASGALFLSACSGRSSGGSSDSSSASSSGGTSNTTITAAYEAELLAYNNNTADQNALQNVIVLNQVQRGFWAYDAQGNVEPDTEFGTYKKTSDDPLTVQYTINPKAVWSDGTAIDCADFMLTWAANSGKYASTDTDENGNPTTGFSSAGTTGYSQMNKPDCSKGDKKITVTYAKPFVDWEGMFGDGSILPAHVVEKQSGVSDLLGAIKSDNTADLNKAAAWYNTGWVGTPGTVPDTWLSDGPYLVKSWQAKQSVTLEANPKWWGTKPKSKTVVIRIIDATQQAQALQNGEVQVAAPQPQSDILAQLKAIGNTVTVKTGQEYSYEHLDFNFKGAFADPNLRKAFALCVPRQQIVDTLLKPVNPDTVVDNLRFIQPFQSTYKGVASAAYSGQYDKVDIAQAKQLVDASGKTGLTVRIGYKTPNERRTSEVSLIKQSCDQAGFNIVDNGSASFFGTEAPQGNFDVALFAWIGSPLLSGNFAAFQTGSGNNYGKYSNPQVDTDMATLGATTDPDKQTQLVGDIEKTMWSDLATIPLWAFPGIQAWSSSVSGPQFQPAQTGETWNMQTWATKAKA